MTTQKKIILIDRFPDVKEQGFNAETYFATFKGNNVIVNATTNNIFFNKHWGSLSVKCTIRGKEHYRVDSRIYAVEPNSFLVLNEGTSYSSYIQSEDNVESFTLHFGNSLTQQLVLLKANNYYNNFGMHIEETEKMFLFTEKLYHSCPVINRSVFRLYQIIKNGESDQLLLEECFYEILFQLLVQEDKISTEFLKIDAIKESTRKELFKRLHYAKDYMDSCFNEDIQLGTLAGVVFMNEAYFLRQFKHFFRVTPKQYLIRKRLNVAVNLLKNKKKSITEICNEIGYADLSSFGKLFKSYYKCTPQKYRSDINKCVDQGFF